MATASRRRAISIVKYAVLTLLVIPLVMLPLWIMVISSFKTLNEATELSVSLPREWAVVENYTAVIERGNYLTGLGNSLLITLPTILLVLLLGSAAAWAYARSRSMTLRVAYYISTLSLLLPPALLPTIYLLKLIDLDATRIGYLLVTVGTRLGSMIFLTTGFIRTLPVDFEEAAMIDGASKPQIYWRMILPLVAPRAGRRVVAASVSQIPYTPRDSGDWDAAIVGFEALVAVGFGRPAAVARPAR